MVDKNIIGIAGLAVMGENLVLNLASRGYSVSTYDRFPDVTTKFIAEKTVGKTICGYKTVAEFVTSLESPRKIMLMIRAGVPVDNFIEQLIPFLERGDIVVDGGNSNYEDSARRTAYLEQKGFLYIGAGVSGGEEGALKGPSLMPGGSQGAWKYLEPIFMDIAATADDGTACCAWLGSGGAGHFVKMVHNGIEYGDMQLICEAYQVMKNMLGMSAAEIHNIFLAWNNGDLKSYLIEITADILAYLDTDGVPLVEKILDAAGQKGTGKRAVNAALDFGVPLSLISESVFARCVSSHREVRLEAEKKLLGPACYYSGDKDAILEDLGKALYAAKIISYTQGFELLQAASQEFGWNLSCAEVARIWRGGCIIRSAFLDKISAAYNNNLNLSNLLLDPYFEEQVIAAQESLRRVVSAGVLAGIPLPSHSSALNYYDSLRSADLPANLLQAQRDYFGAHMYERKDKPRGEWFHTDWTGAGGTTTSTAYSK